MKILFVSRFLPHAAVRDSGGQDTYHYIEALSQRHEVSLISFATADQGEAVASMEQICQEVVAVPFDPDGLGPRLWRAGWRVLLPKVYGRNVSFRYRDQLRQLCQRQPFDVAIVDGMMARYGRYLSPIPRLLDQVDIYATVAYHAYQTITSPRSRWWAKRDWLRTYQHEIGYATGYDAILVRSTKDQTILQDYLPQHPIFVLPPWFEGLEELSQIASIRPAGNKILLMGAMNLPANTEAALFFAERVFPLVRTTIPDAHLYIVGSNPTTDVCQLGQHEGITVTGEVDSLYPYYEQCAVNVVPLFVGGGIIVKTLNGLAAGRPTVATQRGNSGTGATAGRDLLVADTTPAPFAQAVIDILTDNEQWHRLATNGRQFVRQTYHWPSIINQLNAFLAEIAAK